MTSEPVPSDRRHLFVIPLAALVAVLPLIVHGCSCGHDFDFHLLNWMEAANQISHGNLHPHWAYTPAYNAGEPRFVFYPPISWYLGALLGVLLKHLPGVSEAAGWNTVPVVFTWIALTASGLTMYRLARRFANANAALLAAAIYLANPYMLFTAYERTAYAELLAAAWMPLLLLAILREEISIPRIALPLSLLWLTNAPAAVMGSYALALLAVIRVVSIARRNETTRLSAAIPLALKTLAGTALGFGLAAFYIIPAAYQRRFVLVFMATITGMRIDHNFLFEHTGSSPDDMLHDQILHTASVVAALLIATTLVALVAIFLLRKRKSSAPPFSTAPLAILTASVVFMLTPLSLPLWRHAPQASFLQFPWRLLAILAPVCALALAALVDRLQLGFVPTAIASVVLVSALTPSAVHVFQQPCDPEDTAPARLALFHSNAGTDPTDEYTPTTADNDWLKPNNPPYWLAASPAYAPPASAQPGLAPMHLNLTAPHAEYLILNLRDYPAWHISLNGLPAPLHTRRHDGLIAFAIPAGASTIDIHFAHTTDQTLGDVTSLLALAVFLVPLRSRTLRVRSAR
jgi:uncharacterized membrane protein